MFSSSESEAVLNVTIHLWKAHYTVCDFQDLLVKQSNCELPHCTFQFAQPFSGAYCRLV